MRISLLLAIAVFFMTCAYQAPKVDFNTEDYKKFRDVVLDLYYAKAAAQDAPYRQRDSILVYYEKDVLRRHDMSETEYNILKNKYLDHPEKAALVFDNLKEYSDSLKKEHSVEGN